jgi:hypothetical protein
VSDADPALHSVPGGACLSDGRADAVLAVDRAEHERRRRVDLGAVLDLALLDSLASLPCGLAVPASELRARDRRRVDSAPAGVIDRSGTGVARRLAPAAEVRLVLVTAGSWPTRIRRAASFARFAPCTIAVAGEPTPEQLLQADYFGVGISGDGASAGRCFLEPARPAPSFSPAHWLFRERAYGAWLSLGGPRLMPESGVRAAAVLKQLRRTPPSRRPNA